MKDAVQWLEMMAEHSQLTDCRPHFARIAQELRDLRRRQRRRRMLVEFTRHDGDKISVNAIAVAWVGPRPDDQPGTFITISGSESAFVLVREPYEEVVEALQAAMEEE